MSQLQTTDQSTAPRGRDKYVSQTTTRQQNTISKAVSSLFLRYITIEDQSSKPITVGATYTMNQHKTESLP